MNNSANQGNSALKLAKNSNDDEKTKEKAQDIDELEDGSDMDDEIQENQFLTFAIATETYGINILNVTEIIRMIKITSIPETFNFIKGIINLRGKIIPVMDVRTRFGLEEQAHGDRTCIIVVNIKDIEIGLIVDFVQEVIEIPENQIENMPEVNNNNHSQRFVKGLGKVNGEVKILLDLNNLLFDEELEKIKSSAA